MTTQGSLFTKTALLDVIVMGKYGGIPGMSNLINDVDRTTATAAERAKRNLSVLASAAMIPGLAALGIVGESLKQYSAFSKMTEQVRGQTNMTTTQLATMRGQVVGFMKEYGSSASDASDAFRRAYNTQSEYFYKGMSARAASAKQAKDAYDVVNEAAKASTATGDAASGIANTIGSVLHAYHLEASAIHGHLTNAQIVMAEMHTASADANTTLGKFSQNLSGVLPMAKELGVSLSTIGGMYGTLTKGGITGPQAQTQVRTLFNELLHQTPKVQQNLNSVSNQTGIDLTHAFSAEGVQQLGLPTVLRMFNEALAREQAQGRNPATVLSSIVTQRRGLAGMTQLLSNQGLSEGDQIAREIELSGQGKYKNAQGKWVSAGYGKNAQGQRYHKTVTDIMASSMLNSLPGQEMKLKGTLAALEIQMGKTFSGPATQLLKILVPALQKLDVWMSKPANAHKLQQWFKIAIAVGAVGGALKLALGTMEILSKAASLTPWGIVIGAAVLLYVHFSGVRKVVDGVASGLWGIAKALGSFAAAHPVIKSVGLAIGGVVVIGLGLAIVVTKIVRGIMHMKNAVSGIKASKNPFHWLSDAITGMGKLTGLVRDESKEADAGASTNEKLAKAKFKLSEGAKAANQQLKALGIAIPAEGTLADRAAAGDKKSQLTQHINNLNGSISDHASRLDELNSQQGTVPTGARYKGVQKALDDQIGAQRTILQQLVDERDKTEQALNIEREKTKETQKQSTLLAKQAADQAKSAQRLLDSEDALKRKSGIVTEESQKRLKILGDERRLQRQIDHDQTVAHRVELGNVRDSIGTNSASSVAPIINAAPADASIIAAAAAAAADPTVVAAAVHAVDDSATKRSSALTGPTSTASQVQSMTGNPKISTGISSVDERQLLTKKREDNTLLSSPVISDVRERTRNRTIELAKEQHKASLEGLEGLNTNQLIGRAKLYGLNTGIAPVTRKETEKEALIRRLSSVPMNQRGNLKISEMKDKSVPELREYARQSGLNLSEPRLTVQETERESLQRRIRQVDGPKLESMDNQRLANLLGKKHGLLEQNAAPVMEAQRKEAIRRLSDPNSQEYKALNIPAAQGSGFATRREELLSHLNPSDAIDDRGRRMKAKPLEWTGTMSSILTHGNGPAHLNQAYDIYSSSPQKRREADLQQLLFSTGPINEEHTGLKASLGSVLGHSNAKHEYDPLIPHADKGVPVIRHFAALSQQTLLGLSLEDHPQTRPISDAPYGTNPRRTLWAETKQNRLNTIVEQLSITAQQIRDSSVGMTDGQKQAMFGTKDMDEAVKHVVGDLHDLDKVWRENGAPIANRIQTVAGGQYAQENPDRLQEAYHYFGPRNIGAYHAQAILEGNHNAMRDDLSKHLSSVDTGNLTLHSFSQENVAAMHNYMTEFTRGAEVADKDVLRMLALSTKESTVREYQQMMMMFSDSIGKGVPDILKGAGDKIVNQILQPLRDAGPKAKEVSDIMAEGLAWSLKPGSPTPSGLNFMTWGNKIRTQILSGFGQDISAAKAESERLKSSLLAGIDNPSQFRAVGEVDGKALAQGVAAGGHVSNPTMAGGEEMGHSGRLGRFAGHISRIGGAVGGGLMTAQMMDQMIDPNGKMGISKDMNKLFNNPVMNAVNTAMMMQGMFGFGGAGHMKKFASKIPGLGKFFKMGGGGAGEVGTVGEVGGEVGGIAGEAGAVSGVADAGLVGGVESTGLLADSTGIGLPVGIALALAGGGLLAFQHRKQLGKWKDTLLAHPGKALGQAGSAIGATFGKTGHAIGKMANNIGSGLHQAINHTIPDFFKFLQTKLGSGLGQIGGFFGKHWQDILSHMFMPTAIWNALPSNWRDAATKAAQGFVHGIGSMAHNIGSTVHNIINDITGPFKHINLLKMGQNFVGSFGKGLKSKGNDLKNAAGAALKNVLHHFQFLSPSPAGVDPAQLGMNFGSSWAKGFSDSGKQLTDAARKNMASLLDVLKQEQDKALQAQDMISKEMVTGRVVPVHATAQKTIRQEMMHKMVAATAVGGVAAGGTLAAMHGLVASHSGGKSGGSVLQKIHDLVYNIDQIMEGKKPVMHMRYTDAKTHQAINGIASSLTKTAKGGFSTNENITLRGSLLGVGSIDQVKATSAKIVDYLKSYLDFTPKNKHNDNPERWGQDFIDAFTAAIGSSTSQQQLLNAVQADFNNIDHWLHFKPANKNNDNPGKWASDFVKFFTDSLGGNTSKNQTNVASTTVLDSMLYYLYFGNNGQNKHGDNWNTSAQNILKAINSTLNSGVGTLHNTGKSMSTAIETGGKFWQMGKSTMKWTIKGINDYINGNKNALNTIGQALASAISSGINSSSGSGNMNIGNYSGTWTAGLNGVPFGGSQFGSGLSNTPGSNRVLNGVVGSWSDQLLGGHTAAYDTDFTSRTGAPTNVVLPGGPNAKWTFVKMTAPDPTGGIGEVWKTPMGHKILFWHMGRANSGASTAESVINANPHGRMAYNNRTHNWQNLVAGQQYRGGTTVGQSGYDNGVNHLCVVTTASGRADLQWLTTKQMGQFKASAIPSVLQKYGGAIASASTTTGISGAVISSQIMQESSGVASSTTQGFDGKDIGLMQYGPSEARQAGGQYTYNPTQNIMTGTKFLNYLLKGPAHGNLRTALAMYNGGPGNPNYAYADSVLNRAKGYTGVGGGATGPGGGATGGTNQYGGNPAYAYNPATDPLAPPKVRTTNAIHYVKTNASPMSFNPRLDTGQISSIPSQENFYAARGQVSAMQTKYGIPAIGESPSLLKKYKDLVTKEYQFWADIQVAHLNARLKSGNITTNQYHAGIVGVEQSASRKAQMAWQATQIAAARTGYTLAKAQQTTAAETLKAYKTLTTTDWANIFGMMGNKAAASFSAPFLNAIKNSINAGIRVATAHANTLIQQYKNTHGGHIDAATLAMYNAPAIAARYAAPMQIAQGQNRISDAFWKGKENRITNLGVSYHDPKTGYHFQGPSLKFLDAITKGSTTKMTPAERHQWLGYEHQKITETAMIANMKAASARNDSINEIKAGAMGGNAEQRQELIKLAKQQYTQQVKQNDQIAISNWHLAQIKATGSASSGAYLGTQGRVLAVRVIGHCADGSVPGTTRSNASSKAKPTTHSHTPTNAQRNASNKHRHPDHGEATSKAQHGYEMSKRGQEPVTHPGQPSHGVAMSKAQHAYEMAMRGHQPVTHVQGRQLQMEAKMQNTHLSQMSGSMQKMYDEQRQSNQHLNGIKNQVAALNKSFVGLAKEMAKKTAPTPHENPAHEDPRYKGMKIGMGNR